MIGFGLFFSYLYPFALTHRPSNHPNLIPHEICPITSLPSFSRFIDHPFSTLEAFGTAWGSFDNSEQYYNDEK